jgi:hypothetical protein
VRARSWLQQIDNEGNWDFSVRLMDMPKGAAAAKFAFQTGNVLYLPSNMHEYSDAEIYALAVGEYAHRSDVAGLSESEADIWFQEFLGTIDDGPHWSDYLSKLHH